MKVGSIFEYLTTYLLPLVGFNYFSPNTSHPIVPLSYKLFVNHYFVDDNTNAGIITESQTNVRDHLEGYLTIQIQCNEENVKFITLDADEEKLSISSENISLKNKRGEPVPIKSSSFTELKNKYQIELHSSLRKGERYSLKIDRFIVALKEDNKGSALYPLYNGTVKRKLSATCARELYFNQTFPSFGSPDITATFEITIGHDGHYTAISNMLLRETKPLSKNHGWVWSMFDKSPPMPAYLVTIVVGELGLVNINILSQDNTSKELNIYSKQERRELTLAVRHGITSLKYFEKYFEKAYPLKKLDFIGIPEYPLHVLEHPGSILFMEAYLFGNNNSSWSIKEGVVASVYSAVAHQWFGVGVTFNQFTDSYWLRKGVCTHLSIEAINELDPVWKYYMDIVSMDYLDQALNEDSYLSATSIIRKDENLENLNNLTIYKGAFLIRKLALIFQKDFQKAIQNFVKSYSQSNADDFYKELDNFKGLSLFGQASVKHVIDSYIYQPGVPVVEVRREKNSVILTQKRYFSASEQMISERGFFDSGDPITEAILPEREAGTSATMSLHQSRSITDKKWLIPVDLRTSRRVIKVLLSSSETSIPDIAADEQILLNYDVLGYYIPKYDGESLIQLVNSITKNYEQFPISNIYQFIKTFLTFAYEGCNGYDYKLVFDLFEFVFKKDEYLLWSACLDGINSLFNTLKFSNIFQKVQNYFKERIRRGYNTLLGNDLTKIPTTFEEGKLRPLMSNLANIIRLNTFEEAALNLFQQWKNSHAAHQHFVIPLHIRSATFCSALRNSPTPRDDFDVIWRHYRDTTTGTVNDLDTLLSLCCVRDLTNIKRLLYYSITKGGLKPNDRVSIFTTVVRIHSEAAERFKIGQNFFEEMFDDIKSVLESTGSLDLLKFYAVELLLNMPSEASLTHLKEFLMTKKEHFQKHDEINRAYRTAKNKFKWIENNLSVISDIIQRSSPSE